MDFAEKVAYLKGLAEGLQLDTETKEGKMIAAIVDVLDAMVDELDDIESEMIDIEDGLDAVSDDLEDLEDLVYDDEGADNEDEGDVFVTTCPECEEEVVFNESVLEDGEVVCPNCGAKLEFDLSDLANAAYEDESEE